MTSLSLPVVRRRFLFMLWLSAALHMAVIGLTHLPSQVSVSRLSELEVRLTHPENPEMSTEAFPEPKSLPVRRSPAQPLRQERQSELVIQTAPQQVAPAPPSAQAPVVSASVVAPVREEAGPQVSIPVLVDTRYYSAKELDVPPSALRRPAPAYPVQAEEQGIAGRVVARLHIEPDGGISKTEVVSVSPGGVLGEMFRKATLDSLKAIRFRPAQRNGQPVRAVVEIPVVFEPEN